MKKKLLIAGHDLKFFTLILEELKKTENFEIKVDKWSGHAIHDISESQKHLEWADIIFCEWGLGNAVWYSKNKLPHQKMYVRMHGQERNTPYYKDFDLDSIDKVITVSPYIYELLNQKTGIPRDKMTVVYNAVDVGNLNVSKDDGYRFNLAIIGFCPKLKRLDLAIEVFEKLWMADNRYKLFIKGKMPAEYSWLWEQDEEREYYEEIFNKIESSPWKDAVIFEEFGSIDIFLKKIGFVLSVSDFETFHLAPGEGMASGAIPVIRNWAGSELVYPGEYIFATTDEMNDYVEKIQKVARGKEEKFVREYVEKHFDVVKVANLIQSLF